MKSKSLYFNAEHQSILLSSEKPKMNREGEEKRDWRSFEVTETKTKYSRDFNYKDGSVVQRLRL